MLSKLTSLLLVVLLVTTISIALLIRPKAMDDATFYFSVAWVLILIVSNWYVSTYFFSNIKEENQTTDFGILPSLHIVVLAYSFFSLILLLIALSISNYQELPTWHWVGQIIGFAVVSSFIILIVIASKTAEIKFPPNIDSKDSLLLKIKILKLRMENNNVQAFNQLKEIEDIVKYSLPHLSVVKDLDTWKKINSEIEEFDSYELTKEEIDAKLFELLILAKSCH